MGCNCRKQKEKKVPDRVDILTEAIKDFMNTGQMIDEISGVSGVAGNMGVSGSSGVSGNIGSSGRSTISAIAGTGKHKIDIKFGR